MKNLGRDGDSNLSKNDRDARAARPDRDPRITNNGVSADAEAARGRNEASAPVSKTLAVAFDWDRRLRHQVIRTLQIGGAREVHVQRDDHRHCLWKLEAELTSAMDTHDVTISWDHRILDNPHGKGFS